MPEPSAFAGILLTAIGPLYQVLKRHYDVKNANLESKIRLARELKDACAQWATRLESTFDSAIGLLDQQGSVAARSEIERQQQDFNALDYGSLARESPALEGLREDPRFTPFAVACSSFYEGAIALKAVAYGTFDDAGTARSLNTDGFAKTARLWKRDVDSLLNDVRNEFRGVERVRQS